MVISWPKILIYFKPALLNICISWELKYVQYKNSKQNEGYYEMAVSVNKCLLLPVKKKYISEK